MGNKTPRQYREDIRKAFARKGLDAVAWLEAEVRRHEQKPRPDRQAIEFLERLRKALAEDAKKPARPRRRSRTGS